MVHRYDVGNLKSPEFQPNGWARVEGLLTRTGVFVYRNPDGTERRELRLDSEVFNADSLKSFGLVPVTDDHPSELLNANNTAKYAVGAVSENVRKDGKFVRASMLVTHADTVAKLKAGKAQLSCGYTCDLELTPGTHQGMRYDAVQRNIRGNHVALVDVARAGPEARIRLDSGDAMMVPSPEHNDTEATVKVTINGVDFDLPEQAVQAITKERSDMAEKQAQHGKELARETARADAVTEQLTAEKKARADASDPVKFTEKVNARVGLLVHARKVLGDEVKLDSKTDQEVMLDVLAKLSPATKFDGKSADYIQARFDIAIEGLGSTALATARQAANGNGGAGARADADDDVTARQRMIEANRKMSAAPEQK